MRYEIIIQFDANESDYTDHIADTLQGIFGVLPYIVDNVDMQYYILEDSNES
jgi:hypothetical protein